MQYLQAFLNGGVYALIASGMALIFGVMRLVNFAHRAFLMVGTYLSYYGWVLLGLNPYWAFPLWGAALFLAAVGIYWLLVRRVMAANDFLQILFTEGISLALIGLAQLVFGVSGALSGGMSLLAHRAGPLGARSDRIRNTGRRLAIAVAAAALVAGCRGQPPPVSTPDRGVAAMDSGPSSTVPSIPVVAPAPDLGGTPDASPAPRAEAAGCQTDAECGPGRVCGRCGQGPGECIPGCSTSADCPPGSRCVQVQCIRCPCPGECMKR